MDIVQVPRRFVKNNWGGTETVLAETCKRLMQMGHNTEIICPNILADKDSEIVDGIKVKRVPYFYPYWGLCDNARQQMDKKGGNLFSFALMKALEEYPTPDLIHLHTGNRVGGIGRSIAQKREIPYVISLHGGICDVPDKEAETWTSPTKEAFEWGKVLGLWVGSHWVLEDADAIICVGEEEKARMQRKFPRKRIIYLPNGVNTKRFSSGNGASFRRRYKIPKRAYVILTVGRIDPQKNQLFAIDLLPELIKKKNNTHLLIIGHVTNEAYYKQLISIISEKNLENHVTIISGLDSSSTDLVNAYHSANIFLLPSVHEPFGIVILEAWAAGLPVIASKVGGVSSLIIDGKDGMLFEADNKKEFLEKFKIAKSRHKTLMLSVAGQKKAREEYGWDKITKRLVSIYEEIIHDNYFHKRTT